MQRTTMPGRIVWLSLRGSICGSKSWTTCLDYWSWTSATILPGTIALWLFHIWHNSELQSFLANNPHSSSVLYSGEDLQHLPCWHIYSHDVWTIVSALHRGNAEEVFQSEVLYTRALILKTPHNESSWNYLRGLCTALGLPHKMSLEPSVATLCLEVSCMMPAVVR